MSDEGEIIARLKLDASDYRAGIEEAKGEARSLTGIDPNIRVTADTATAIAGLNAVAVSADKVAIAEERLRTSVQASDRATASAMLAQMRLEEVQNKRGRTAYQVASAEEALRVATERADNAALKAIAAEDQLAAARRDAAKAALEEGAAADVAGAKTTGAAQGAIPWMGILVGAIAAVSPGIVATGAAVIGLAGSLTGMGAAGVLAVLGIKSAMESGLPIGNTYSELLATLQGDLTTLEQTAAQGSLTGFSASVSTVNNDLGPLNSTIGRLSNQLGGLLATGADTAVHAISGFTPVLLVAGQALQGFLTGIDSFTQSNGFTAFVQYTIARLPDVMHLLDATLGAVGGLFSGLAPAGQATLFMLSSLMDLITALSPTIAALMPTVIGLSDAIGGVALVAATVLNALGPIGPAAVLTTAAFIGLSFASKAVAASVAAAAESEVAASAATRVLGAAVDFAMGPIGLAIIAAGFLASAFATMGDSSQQSASDVQSLTTALQEDNGALGSNTRAAIAHNLANSDAAQGAAKLGLSMKTLTAASLGDATARAQVNAATQKQIAANDQLTSKMRGGQIVQQAMNDQTRKTSNLVTSQNTALKSAIVSYNSYASAIGGTTIKSGQQLAAQQRLAARYGMDLPTYMAAAAALQKNGAAAQAAGNGYASMAGMVDLATRAEYGLETTSDNAVVAIGGMASTLSAAAKAAHDHTASLNGDTVAGAQNRLAITSAMESISKHAQTMRDDGKSAAEAKAYTDTMTASLINNAVKAGANRSAVAELIATILGIPKSAALKITTNAAAAEQKIIDVRNQMAAINGLTSTVYVSAVAAGVSSAQASVINRQAQMLGAHGAQGGTTGSSGFGAIPHLAAGGTITGAGTAATDTAGIYALANTEEVVSNLHGGATMFRSLLKGISAGTVRTPAQAMQALGGAQQPQPVTVIVQARDGAPDFTDYVDVRVVQGIQAQQAENRRVLRLGRLDRGLLAGA